MTFADFERGFEKDFRRSKKRFNILFGIVVVMCILIFCGLVTIISTAIMNINERGLKKTIERVWEGPTTNQ